MAKLTLSDILSAYQSTTKYNANNVLIETALENTLSRDGMSPNQMEVDLDLNGYNLLNQGNPIAVSGLVWKGPWSNSEAYIIGDIAEDAGTAYITIADHTNQQPPNATYWQVFMQATGLPTINAASKDKFLHSDGSISSWQGAIVSEASAPTNTYAYLLWADTTNNLLKIRNVGDTAWITIGDLTEANLGLMPAVTGATEDNVCSFDANGDAQDSSVAIGVVIQSDVADVIETGFGSTFEDHGTKTGTATVTPDFNNSNFGTVTLGNPTAVITLDLPTIVTGQTRGVYILDVISSSTAPTSFTFAGTYTKAYDSGSFSLSASITQRIEITMNGSGAAYYHVRRIA